MLDKDIAPTTSLRKWFSHDEGKWDEFKIRYFKELDEHSNSESINKILDKVNEEGSITLLYGAKDERFSNSVALKEYLEQKIKKIKEKKRNLDLSAEEMKYNKSHSKKRIVIKERAMWRLKKYMILAKDIFRNRLKKYNEVSDIVSAGLINYRIINQYR